MARRCNTCRGGGNVECPDCRGAGRTGAIPNTKQCRTCRGSGHIACVVCDHTGRQLEPGVTRRGRRRRSVRGWRWRW